MKTIIIAICLFMAGCATTKTEYLNFTKTRYVTFQVYEDKVNKKAVAAWILHIDGEIKIISGFRKMPLNKVESYKATIFNKCNKIIGRHYKQANKP